MEKETGMTMLLTMMAILPMEKLLDDTEESIRNYRIIKNKDTFEQLQRANGALSLKILLKGLANRENIGEMEAAQKLLTEHSREAKWSELNPLKNLQ